METLAQRDDLLCQFGANVDFHSVSHVEDFIHFSPVRSALFGNRFEERWHGEHVVLDDFAVVADEVKDFRLCASGAVHHAVNLRSHLVKESFDDGKPIVKRVIATEGQTVDIDFDSGMVFVDGQALDEPYVNTPTNLPEGVSFPLQVEENCYFVMGDNRNSSRDSRSPEIGQVDRREILGKAFFLMFPGTDKNTVSRDLNRMGVLK